MITIETIGERLEELRREWVLKPLQREIIKRRARALQIAKEKIESKLRPLNQTASFLPKACPVCKSTEFVNDVCITCHPLINSSK